MSRVVQYLEGQSRLFFLGLGLVLVLGAGAADYLTGAVFSLAPLYLLPVALAAWFAGRDLAILLSIVSAGVGILVEALLGANASPPGILGWNALVDVIVFVGVALLLAALRDARGRGKGLPGKDALTSLDNLQSFTESAGREIDQARRYGHQFTLIAVDIDGFKDIDEGLGRRAGEALLRQVADVLRKNGRESDVVARLGADEFAVLLPEAAYESAQARAHRLHADLVRAVAGNKRRVTFSVAVVTFDNPPVSVEEALQQTTDLLRSIKGSGGNAVMHEVWG